MPLHAEAFLFSLFRSVFFPILAVFDQQNFSLFCAFTPPAHIKALFRIPAIRHNQINQMTIEINPTTQNFTRARNKNAAMAVYR